MRGRLLGCLATLLFICASASAQFNTPANRVKSAASLPASCASSTTAKDMIWQNGVGLSVCSALNTWAAVGGGGGGGTGTVTTLSVVSANGFAGSVANATTTPAITLTTTVTGLVKGNGTAFSAATAGTDYVAPGGALGTPSSGTLTNASGLPTTGLTGTLQPGQVPAFTGDATNTAGSLAMTVARLNGVALSGLATGILKNTTGTGAPSIAIAADFPTLNQNTTGTASNVSGTPALPNGTTATTQAAADNSTKLATTAYADRAGFTPPTGTGVVTVTSGAVDVASTAFTSNATASTVASRDSSANTRANSHIDGYTTTATAASTSTLTVASTKIQLFTGSTTQTVVLPVTSTLVLGQEFRLVNLSTGTVTVNSSGSNLVLSMLSGDVAAFICVLTSGTTAASWQAIGYARNDAAQTFHGNINMGSGGSLTVVNDANFQGNNIYVGNLAVALTKIATNVLGVGSGSTTTGWINYNGTGRVASDLTNATATMSNITLSQNPTLIAGRKYIGKLSIKCNNSTATEGIQFDFGGGTATFTSFAAGGGVLASGGTDVIGTNITTSNSTAISFTTLTGESWIVIEVSFVCNAAGTIIPRFAEASSAVGTATLRANSFFSLMDTP